MNDRFKSITLDDFSMNIGKWEKIIERDNERAKPVSK